MAAALRAQAAGFADLDARPSLNPTGRPAHFNELSITRQLHAWAAGSASVEPGDPYAALLASILSLQRSAAIAKGPLTLRETFEANKHQQLEIERQERLRPLVGVSADMPTRNGLPDPTSPLADTDRQLIYDFRLILLLYALALELCMHQRVFGDLPPTPPAPGRDSAVLHFRWHNGARLSLSPYPFARGPIPVTITGRPVLARAYDHELELHEALATAPQLTLQVILAPGD